MVFRVRRPALPTVAKLPYFSLNSPFWGPTPQFLGSMDAYDGSRLRYGAIWALLWPGLAVTTHLAGFCTSCGACVWPGRGRRRSCQQKRLVSSPFPEAGSRPGPDQRERLAANHSDRLPLRGEDSDQPELQCVANSAIRSFTKVDSGGGLSGTPMNYSRQLDHRLRRAI